MALFQRCSSGHSKCSFSNGFGLIELLVALSIASVLGLAAANVYLLFEKEATNSILRSETSAQLALNQMTMMRILQKAGPSFNVFADSAEVRDQGSRNFFDLNSEFPVKLRATAEQTRRIVLPDGGRRSIVFIVQDDSGGSPVIVDPIKFYNWAAGDMNTSGSLAIGDASHVATYMTALAPRMYQSGRFIYFNVIASSRPASAGPSAYVKPVGLFTRVTGSGLVVENFGGLVSNSNPLGGADFSSLDDFLRRLPSASGAIPFVYARNVQMIRFVVEDEPGVNGPHVLASYRWSGSDFVDRSVLSFKVASVTFSRPSVGDPQISYEITNP